MGVGGVLGDSAMANEIPTHPVRKFFYWTGWAVAQILCHPTEALAGLIILATLTFYFFCVDVSQVDRAVNVLLGR